MRNRAGRSKLAAAAVSTDRIADAVGSYVTGALLQALIAGAAAWVMLVMLGVPSPLPLAVIVFLLDLIPLDGATLGAVIVGGRDPVHGLPHHHDHLAIFAIAYQQFENYVVQPRIQSRGSRSTLSSWSSRRSSGVRSSA